MFPGIRRSAGRYLPDQTVDRQRTIELLKISYRDPHSHWYHISQNWNCHAVKSQHLLLTQVTVKQI